MRRNAKVDNNHADIVQCLRDLGFSVLSLAPIGRGAPDIAFARGDKTYLAEIKNSTIGWKLTDAQRKFHANWKGKILIFDSVETVRYWENGSSEI